MLRVTINSQALATMMERLMEQHGLSQAGLACRANLSPAMVSELMRLRHLSLSLKMARRVEEGLGVPRADFVMGNPFTPNYENGRMVRQMVEDQRASANQNSPAPTSGAAFEDDPPGVFRDEDFTTIPQGEGFTGDASELDQPRRPRASANPNTPPTTPTLGSQEFDREFFGPPRPPPNRTD